MSIRIIRLGSDRVPGEGLRIGTVRRPPRGVPKSEYSSQNWFDVWFPNLAPSAETVKLAQDAGNDKEWAAFVKKYKAEMATPDNSRTLDLLAALSHQTIFPSVATAPTNPAVIAPCSALSSPREARTCGRRGGPPQR